MNNANPFVRKIIYIAAIGLLLIPLSLVSRPEIRDGNGNIENAGGQLSKLREEYSLSQAKLAEIDPASETMKLASLGLRGVAVNMLWMQAMEHKKKENYDQLASTLKALTKIQPNFVKVWKFQAHNLAYNVSMEFDDYEYRYHWVKRGIAFLKEGVAYNKTDHRMTDELGFFTGNKFGKSDERDSFRRMFRRDDEFHSEMSDFIDPESYDTRGYGPDNWKMAYQWYDFSRRLVQEQSYPQRSSDMMFYMYRPSQLRNQAMSLQNEYRTDEIIQEIWRASNDEWLDYGEEPISNTLGVTITLEGMVKNEKELESLREQLDEIVPGVRQEQLAVLKDLAEISDEEMYAFELPFDQRNDEQIRIAREVQAKLQYYDADLEDKIAMQAKPDDQLKARRIVEEIKRVIRQMATIDKDSGTVNYAFWKARTKAESTDICVRARQALFDADEMRRKSIYDDEFDRDFKTKKITITKRGAISQYLDAFAKWHEVLEQNPDLQEGPLSDDLARAMEEFREILVTSNREWPEDFPLQDLIDARRADGEPDALPTSEELEEMRSGFEEDSDEEPAEEMDVQSRELPTPVDDVDSEIVPGAEDDQ